MWKRLVRLYKAFLPARSRPDDAWAEAELMFEEVLLYRAMDSRDREHAVGVARRLLERYPDAPGYVVRAALLHDSGKALRPYKPLERVLTGLLTLKVPLQPLHTDWRGAWQVRQYHPEYAARRIMDLEVAALVREHHAPQSEWGRRLHEVDEEF
ncbi:MAG: HD domain-containing protein [Meiothermus sp.]|nr:HD domain-containing protein [Meiothermus sp.]